MSVYGSNLAYRAALQRAQVKLTAEADLLERKAKELQRSADGIRGIASQMSEPLESQESQEILRMWRSYNKGAPIEVRACVRCARRRKTKRRK